MNKLYLLIYTLILLVGCSAPSSHENERIEVKMAPSDFMMQRYAYPDSNPDIEAYKAAIAKADRLSKSNAAGRSATTPWRQEGPGNSGARINTIAAHPTNANIMLVGYSGGGIYKTVDGGANWYPVFDDEPVLAISAIVYDPTNSNILYAGTGDLNISSYPFVGNGIYKSIDGGDTWSQSGLDFAGIISKILVDPNNGNIVYAASMGVPFAAGSERGLYKSTDGGASWTKILYLGTVTGVIDLAMDPVNSSIIYAAGWDRVRNTQQSIVLGPGAKIHRSTDAGNNWTTLGGGLPTGNMSRIGLAASHQNGGKLYAVYINSSFEVEGIYQTLDGGDFWISANMNGLSSGAMGGFGWYFGKIRTQPNNDDILYLCGVQLWRSINSGDNWSIESLAQGTPPHVDMHDVQFDANLDALLATDGGLYHQTTPGGPWTDMENIPATQFYRIAVNPHQPGVYYGGAQDNGTLSGSFNDPNNWTSLFGGDGFSVVFHPTDQNTFYIETQNGNIWRTLNGGANWDIASNGLNNGDSRPWDMFFSMSPYDPDVMYTGTQSVYESQLINGDVEFSSISGNLTESDTASNAQRYHFITHVVESQVTQDLLVCGTSDGLVWRRQPGQSWELINTGLPDRYVTRVIPSEIDDQDLFVTHSGYKDNDNTPHIHFSDDQGTTWQNISGNMPSLGINDLIVIPNTQDSTLIIATDGGVYFSLDKGTIWELLGTGLPSVPVYDLALDTLTNRLVAGTFAKSILSFPMDSLPSSATSLTAAGLVKNRLDVPMEGVDIAVETESTITNSGGNYSVSFVPGENCEIEATRTSGDIRNGISGLDAVLVQRHAILLDTLSPIQQLAGDVSNGGSLSTLDAVMIQRVVIFLDNTFPRGNWGFLPTSYVIPDSTDIFSEAVPSTITCSAGQMPTDLGFWAYKVGDVTGNANNSNAPQWDRDLPVSLSLRRNNGKIELVSNDDVDLYSLQLSLKISDEPNGVYSELENTISHYANGILRWNWISGTGRSFEKDDVILSFDSENGHAEISSLIKPLAVIEENRSLINVPIAIESLVSTEEIIEENSLSIYPNPAGSNFWISSGAQAIERVVLYDMSGKVIAELSNSNSFGPFNIPSEIGNGSYLLQISTPNKVVTKKLAIIR